jgi:uncharacterized membrane protein YgcG
MKAKLLSLVILTMVSFGAMASTTNTDPQARVNELTQRVYEIRDMDRTELSKEERAELKAELREIQAEMKAQKGLDSKITMSVGLIIIILLLIILL